MDNSQNRIVFFGTPEFVVPVLDSLRQNYNLVAVVSAPDKPVGRRQILTPSPVKLASAGLQVLSPVKLDDDLAQNLSSLKPDLFVVAAYGKIIPSNLLDIPKYGALNIHPSLLPKYRGPSPLQNTILNGDTETGVTIMKIDDQMDHGPIISTSTYRLSYKDNYLTLGNKLFRTGAAKLLAVLPDFTSGKLVPQPQNHATASYTKIITKEDGYFEINKPPDSKKLDRMIRAFYPWPTAWTKWQGKIIKFLPEGLIQMEGKNPIPLKDFLNGYQNFPLKNLDL